MGPNELRVKAGPDGGHTLVGVFESTMPPGGGFPFAHVHDEHEEVCNSSRYPARHLVVHALPTAQEMIEEIGQALRDQWDGILESTGRDPSTAEAPAICRYT